MPRSNVEHDAALIRPQYGTSNPQRVGNPVWEQIIRNNWRGSQARDRFGVSRATPSDGWGSAKSAYREKERGPAWSWDRFGRTSTKLNDGRIVHIGGEHEDWYDSDFCIYNDVVVEHPDGRLDIYVYPKGLFPPTDFHTATLVGDKIILIGSLGYADLRRIGETQVLRLDARKFKIERVGTRGPEPGWIHKHVAEHLPSGLIVVAGGKILGADGEFTDNQDTFELDLRSFKWRKLDHGDRRVFPVAAEVYRVGKSPRLGVANPERVDNPFWEEMARRGWRPSRARLHFGDLAPKPASKGKERAQPPPAMADVVWTAVRKEAAVLTLNDGRRLMIGGEFDDYDERFDRWTYNDVIITHSDRRIEILTYPEDVFPAMNSLCAAPAGGRFLIFGVPDIMRESERPRVPIVLAFDPESLALEMLDPGTPPRNVLTYGGPHAVEADRILFHIQRQTREDPERFASFDLTTLRWRALD